MSGKSREALERGLGKREGGEPDRIGGDLGEGTRVHDVGDLEVELRHGDALQALCEAAQLLPLLKGELAALAVVGLVGRSVHSHSRKATEKD